LLAFDLKYISADEYKKVLILTEESSKLLAGWIKSQRLIS
jgi:hypothetical protein